MTSIPEEMESLTRTVSGILDEAVRRSGGRGLGSDDRARVHLVLRTISGLEPNRGALTAALRRVRLSGNLPSLVQLAMLVGGLPSQLRSLEGEVSKRFPELGVILERCAAGDSQHPYYDRTWWSVTEAEPQLRLDALNRVTEFLRERGLSLTAEALCVLAGAPLALVQQFERMLSAWAYVPHPGELAVDQGSTAKHQLNELILECWSQGRPINIFEGCQGGGDGTRSYQAFGAVVAAEISARTLGLAARRVAHLRLHLDSPVRLAGSPLGLLESLGWTSPPYPALMPVTPIGAAQLAARLSEWNWRFEWIDLDTYGMIETSNIDLKSVLGVAADTAIIAISNGISWQRRFLANVELENQATRVLVGESSFHSVMQRRDQRELLFDHVLEVEVRLRIEQALEMGCELHPLVLYDGRTHTGGIHRGYYFFRRAIRSAQRERLRASVSFRRDLLVKALRSECLTDLAMNDPDPSRVLILKFSDIVDGDALITGAVLKVRKFLKARISLLD